MKYFTSTLLVFVFASSAAVSFAQDAAPPAPGPELDVFKAEVGTWDVEITVFVDPEHPETSKGKETNRMLGGFWLLTNFEGKMMGMDFKGHGMYGYDTEKKQYVGTWVDSVSSKKMEMVGTHDAASRTMTYEGMASGPDGKATKHVLKTQYTDDGGRVMTMHMQADEAMIKIFEMNYTKAAAE